MGRRGIDYDEDSFPYQQQTEEKEEKKYPIGDTGCTIRQQQDEGPTPQDPAVGPEPMYGAQWRAGGNNDAEYVVFAANQAGPVTYAEYRNALVAAGVDLNDGLEEDDG